MGEGPDWSPWTSSRNGRAGGWTKVCCGADHSRCWGNVPAVFTGAVAPADLAGTEVLAVAEARSLADDAEGSPSSIHVSKQLRAVVDSIVTVPELIEHSVDQIPSEEGGGPMNIVPVPEPLEHSVNRRPSEGEIVRWTL